MRFTKKLTDKDWAVIKTRYEKNETTRDIAYDYDIAPNTVINRAKKFGWEKGKLKRQLTDLRENIKEIAQTSESEQLPIISAQIKSEIDEILQIEHSIMNLSKGFLNTHQMILKSTIDKFKAGQINEFQTAKILQMQGGTFNNIATITGVSKERHTNIDVNSNDKEIIVNITGK